MSAISRFPPMLRAALAGGMACLAMLCATLAAADAVITRPADLRAERYVDAATLGRIDSGTHVDVVKTEAGWVQIRFSGQTGWVRATSMLGDAAAVAPLARLETGRGATGNIVVAAGIRGIPKASRHALIIGVASTSTGGARPVQWPGVNQDIDSAQLIAGQLGINGDNIDIVRGDDASFAGIESALARLSQRVQPGDSVLLYFSGPGGVTSQGTTTATCNTVWFAADGRSLTARDLVRGLQPVLDKAAKFLIISDASYVNRGTVSGDSPSRKAVTTPIAPQCATTTDNAGLPIVDAATVAGASPMNVVHIQSAGPEQGVDQPRAGGVFTQVLLDCFLGDAIDLNQSASISVDELASCVNRRGRGADKRGAALAMVSGNAGFSPTGGVATTLGATPAPVPVAAAPGTVSPQAAISDVLAQSDGRVRVEIVATPSSLQIGRDYLDLKVTSSHDGFVYLILLGSDEKSFYLLFPNDLDRDNHIGADETLRLPRASWRVQSQGPAGRDVVLAVVAESKRDLNSFSGQKAGPFSAVLTDATGRAQLQWLLARSAQAEARSCIAGGKQRNLAVVKSCSDAFGATRIEVVEH